MELTEKCENYNFSKELCNTFYSPEAQLYKVKIHSLPNPEQMNTIELKVSFEEQKARLKQKFAVLTNNDRLLLEGKKEELSGRFQAKLGRTQEDLRRIIIEI